MDKLDLGSLAAQARKQIARGRLDLFLLLVATDGAGRAGSASEMGESS